MAELRLIEKELAETPIELPKSPFVEVFERFGSCQAIALVLGAVGTSIVNDFVKGENTISRDLTISLGGRIAEKPAFFIPPFLSEIKRYRTIPKDKRDRLGKYLKRAAKTGGKNFLEDLAVQDVITTGTMYAALNFYPGTPPWMLSILCSIASTVAVSGLEVAVSELSYLGYKTRLKRAGFNSESYLESRFFISGEKNPDDVLNELDKEFKLGEIKEWSYSDRYFTQVRVPHYSGRTPEVRLRAKKVKNDHESIKTAEVTFKRACEISSRKFEQNRYVPSRKDKLAYAINQESCDSIDEIENPKVRKILEKAVASGEHQDVYFDRTEAHNLDTLQVTLDHVHGEGKMPFYLVELKTRAQIGLLEESMRYVMRNFPVLETTYEKLELVNMDD